MHIETYFPNFYTDAWVGHSCLSVVNGLLAEGIDIDVIAFCCSKEMRARRLRVAVPLAATRFIKNAQTPIGKWIMNSKFSRSVERNDIAYFWIDSDMRLIDKVRRRGAMVVREMINCTLKRRNHELRRAYDLLGMSFSEHTDFDVQREAVQLNACDAIFCPNPYVRESVIDAGISPSKCIDCSYGWSEARFPSRDDRLLPHDGIHVLFVGMGNVRKGLPWLLRAWKMSRVKGYLLLAGQIAPEVQRTCPEELALPTVRCLGFQPDMGAVYRQADIFAFPSWEEGGPMVTLEAMAHGLPCLVTPMGTSGAVTDKEGFIVQPGSVDQMAEALVTLAANAELRHALGIAARQKAQCYTWPMVARRRLEGLHAAYAPGQWRAEKGDLNHR